MDAVVASLIGLLEGTEMETGDLARKHSQRQAIPGQKWSTEDTGDSLRQHYILMPGDATVMMEPCKMALCTAELG